MGTVASTRKGRTNRTVHLTGHEEKSDPAHDARRNKEIELQLAKDKDIDSQSIKLLLLGGSESGKSTFVKQMRILHLNGFTDVEIPSYKKLVRANTIMALNQLLEGMRQLGVDMEDISEDLENFHLSTQPDQSEYTLTLETGSIVKRIWLCTAVQSVYEKRSEFILIDSAKYFLDNIDRISACDYIPTLDDIVRARASTIGIYEISFIFNGKNFRLVDVGGQKSQRRKWIHCFDDVMAILFVASLADYDLQLNEDPTVNRLDDSLTLFAFITKNILFANTAVILFLNKKDVLAEKLETSPFTKWDRNYSGDPSHAAVREAILHEFSNRAPLGKAIYPYFTEATSTRNIEAVFAASMDIVLSRSLTNVGLT